MSDYHYKVFFNGSNRCKTVWIDEKNNFSSLENQIESKYKNEIGNKRIEIYYKLSGDTSSIIESDKDLRLLLDGAYIYVDTIVNNSLPNDDDEITNNEENTTQIRNNKKNTETTKEKLDS